ncbi:MAG TPA: hypothetical protein VG870_06260 [Chitinophagaceae bacterium]|nr:hypothetical protein [Chitinophagaceae bacterium]
MASVITADIVNSTALTGSREGELRHKIGDILKETLFEFYRGNSFQAYFPDRSGEVLKILFRLRTAARSLGEEFDIRAGIGIGMISGPFQSIREAGGEVFTHSGRAFDRLHKQRLGIVSPREYANLALAILCHFADHLFSTMTAKQAQVIQELLEGKTQVAAARILKKSQSTINKHALAGGWGELERLTTEYGQLLKQFDLR